MSAVALAKAGPTSLKLRGAKDFVRLANSPTKSNGRLAQLARATHLHWVGRGFESSIAHKNIGRGSQVGQGERLKIVSSQFDSEPRHRKIEYQPSLSLRALPARSQLRAGEGGCRIVVITLACQVRYGSSTLLTRSQFLSNPFTPKIGGKGVVFLLQICYIKSITPRSERG